MSISRRNALALGGLSLLGAAGLTVPLGGGTQAKSVSRLADRNFPRRYASAFVHQPLLQPVGTEDGQPLYEVTARRGSAQICPGLTTPVHAYDGQVPGPLIKVEQGRPVKLRVRNHLPTAGPWGGQFAISTHLHGSASLPEHDGYASDLTRVGQFKTYEYPNSQAARTLWYHDHGLHWTAQNAYGGLAAQYHLSDATERALLPQGEFDVPLTVTDAMFNANGSLAYDDSSHSGLWGDVVLVNGVAWPVMKVKRRTYRFRILVASIARSYRWRLSNGLPLQVVATDGGLMPRGVALSSFRHAGSERYEVVVDFSKVPVGTRVELQNLSNPNNVDYDHTGKVMQFEVVGDPVQPDGNGSYNRDYDGLELAPGNPVMTLQPTGSEKKVNLRVERSNGEWQINGKTWVDVEESRYRDVVANPAVGETQVWTIQNGSGGWFHPLHVHLVDFKVIGRTGGSGTVQPQERGPKDVVYVGENETVQLLIRFGSPDPGAPAWERRQGRYMVHCHNLPHEDHDMMQQFCVGDVDAEEDPHDPVRAAPAVPDPTYRG